MLPSLTLLTLIASPHPVLSAIPQREGDGIFRRMLLEGATPKQQAAPLTAAALGRLPRWKKVEPLVKSFLGNTLHLLGEAASWQLLWAAASSRRRALHPALSIAQHSACTALAQHPLSGSSQIHAAAHTFLARCGVVGSPEQLAAASTRRPCLSIPGH